ncbi:restriction endonuclease subunit S [Methylomonas sp. 2B]
MSNQSTRPAEAVNEASAAYRLQAGKAALLRPGYKMTEVGVIPEDWASSPLGKHASFRTGPFGSALHKSDYANDGIPVINPMHIINGKIEPTRTMTITEQAAKNLSEFRLKPGEIVIGRRGDMGRCAVVQENQSGWLCGTGSMIIRPLNTDAEFLQRVLSSPRAISAIEDSSVGTTMVNLNQGTLAGLKIQFPPLPEQKAIAAALSDVDALLDGLERLIAKKRDLKQAAMQQLLTGQTRLPGFSGEWEIKRLGDLAKFYKGKGLPKSALTPFGSEPCIHYGELFTQYGETIRETISRTDKNTGDFRSVANDVLMPTSDVTPRGLAKASCVVIDEVVLGGDILVIRTDPAQVCGTFLSHVIRREEDQVLRLVTGTTVFHLYGTDMKKFVLKLPLLAEQQAIVEVLADMDAELAVLEARRDKTRALKQGMMQELLTGKTRLL